MAAVFDETVQAPTFIGNLQGNVTGSVVGSVSGNVVGNLTGNTTGRVNGGIIPPGTNLAGDGAISIPSASAMFYITKGSAAALTIAAPTAGTDDFKELVFWSETAFMHVITCASDGFNAKGASGTASFGGAKGDSIRIVARNGHWWTAAGAINVVVA